MGREKVMFMRFGIKGFQSVLFVAFSLQVLQASPAIAQIVTPPPIIPGNGTGTEVLPNGNQIDINGGIRIDNNLFHNFREFNVPAGNDVNFNVPTQIENVLNGVSGRNPSVISGSINMPSSNANFYLINPAGIVFGNGAQVNINGAFTATTARTVNFGDRSLDILNPNYANLSGNVTGFEFDPNSNAAIVNSGNLNAKSVTLAAPTVVNTGNINASNGGVNIVAMPSDRLRLNLGEPGLYYEFATPRDGQGNALPFKALDLPSLLTTGKLENTGVSLNSQGQAQLTGSQTVIPNTAGTAIVSGNISVAAPMVSSVLSKIQISGDRIGVVGASLDASGLNGGGSIFIGGDFQGKGIIPNALMTFVSADSTIKADALQSGNGGRVIVWADNGTRFLGSVSARGGAVSGNGGFVEISGKENLVFDGKANLDAINGKGGTLLFDPTDVTICNNASCTFTQAFLQGLSGNTNVLIEATNNITVGTLTGNNLAFARGLGSISFIADSDNNGVGSFSMNITDRITASSPQNQPILRNLNFSGASLNLGIIQTRGGTVAPGGNISIRATNGNIVSSAIESYADFNPAGNPYNAGDVSIVSDKGSIDTRAGIISARANITLQAERDIYTSALLSGASGANGRSGSISITSTNGVVDISTAGGLDTNLPGQVGLFNTATFIGGGLAGIDNKLTINAYGNIKTNLLLAEPGANTNTFVFRSQTGSIEIPEILGTQSTLNLGIIAANAVNVDIEALQNINVGNIRVSGTFRSGSVNLKTTAGNITTTTIDTTSFGLLGGNAGSINIDAGGDASIDGLLRAFSQAGNGGDVSVKASGNLSFNCIVRVSGACGVETFPEGNSIPRNSGNININSVNGSITVLRGAALNSASDSDGNSGSITLSARKDITMESGFINSALDFSNGRKGSDITITSTNGNVNISAPLTSRSASGQGGAISIDAFGNINTGFIGTSLGFNSGAVSLKTTTGNITVQSIDTISSVSVLGGNAGKISIESAGNVTVDGLLRAFSPTGNGADVSVKANNGNILFTCATLIGGKCGVETFPEGTAAAIAPSTVRSAGNINLDSTNGSITLLGNAILDAGADSANAPGTGTDNRTSGTVTISAQGDITTGLGGITSDASFLNGEPASNIIITSSQGKIRAFNITANSFNGRGGDVVFSAPNGISVNSVISGDSGVGSSGGNITFNGKFDLLENSIVSTGTVSSGNITFTSTIDGANALNIIANTGTVNFQGAIGSLTPLTGLTTTAQNANLNGNVSATNSNLIFDTLLTLTAPSILKAGTAEIQLNRGLSAGNNPVSLIADNITLANAIAGTNTLTIQPSTTNRNIVLGGNDATALNLTSAEIATITGFSQVSIDNSASTGSIAFTAPVTFNAPTTILSGTGSTLLNASITTTGQNLTFGNAILGTNVAINTTGGNVLFNGTLNGTQDLTINSGIGNTTFNGTIGATNPLRNLAIASQNVIFNEILTTGNNGNVTITNTGTLTIAKGMTLDGSFTQNGTGNSILTNGISTTNDSITFTSLLTLNGLINFTIGNADFSFGALNIGANPLTLAANEIDFTGGANSVTGTNRLILQPNTASQDINVGGAIATTALDITATDLAALGNGFSQVQIGRTDGTGNINITGTANFQDPATLVTMGTTNINAPIVGNDNASLNVTATNINLNANLSSNGQAIALNGNTRLITNPTINSNGGNISTNGTIDSQAGTNLSLFLNAGTGNILLNGAVGNTDRLSNIDLSAANISISGGINTVNSLQISNPITITGTSTFSNLIGDININAPIAIQAGTSANVTISAATGNVNTQNIDLSLPAAAGNSIALRSPQGIVTTGDLNVSGTSGGNINIQALTAITTGRLSARGTAGNGGVIVLDPLLDIVAGAIDAQGFGGVGGSVDLTTNRFARIIGVIVDQNGLAASITTAGTAGDGVIIIRHDGGTRFEPFNVFSSLINGTDGVLTTGAGNTIFTPQSFPGPYTQGNIQIITAANFTIFLAGETLNGPPEIRWQDEGDRSPFPPEEFYTKQFANFFKESIADYQSPKAMTLTEVQETLRRVQSETGVNPALLYVTFMPDRMSERQKSRVSSSECLAPPEDPNAISPKLVDLNITQLPDYCDILELTLVTSDGKPTYIRVEGKDGKYIRRNQVEERVESFTDEVSALSEDITGLIESSKKLYDLLIDNRQIQSALTVSKINNLTFILPEALRQIPFAALQNPKDQFIIEEYSVGMMPSLSLTDTRRSVISDKRLLALGVSKFSKVVNKSELPYVEKELTEITNIWNSAGKPFLNDDFTLDKLDNPRDVSIIHIATHASFDDQKGIGSIVLKDSFVSLNQMRSFNWKNIPVELLVLSACQTSVGNTEYELGFAGMAVRANVKSAIGSLWEVKDLSTAELMANFYLELKNDKEVTKADALKRAQIKMLRSSTDQKFRHPYYWSTFTLIGNPW